MTFVPYGRGNVELRRPSNSRLLETVKVPPVADLEASLARALDSPIGRAPFDTALAGRSRVLVLVPDKTRHAHVSSILPILMPRLPQATIRILVAAGDHPPHSAAELSALIGEGLSSRVETIEHRASDEAACVEIGRTPRGTPVRLNRAVVEADALILIGSVSHHYFAGFGGGPKALFPGAAARSSIQVNHGRVIKDGDKDPNACQGRLDGNPVHEDICDAVALTDPAFLINVVNDGDGRPLAFFAGHWKEAHRAACRALERVAALPDTDGPFDLLAVSAGGWPHDINLVQSHKAMDRMAPLLRDGGTMLLLAECAQGYGDPDLERRLGSMTEGDILEELTAVFRVKAHTALCILRKARRLKMHMVSKLASAPLEGAGIVAESDAAIAWERLLSQAGPSARVGIVPAGHFAVPAQSSR